MVLPGGSLLNLCMDRLAAMDLSTVSGLLPPRALRMDQNRVMAQARDVTPRPLGDFSIGLVLIAAEGWRITTYDEKLLTDR